MLKKIIDNNCIQQVGIEYAEMIISKDNFVEVAKQFKSLGYQIASVCWFGHLKISDIGKNFEIVFNGGPTDKNDKEYFWAETNFGKDFESKDLSENLEQVLNYYSDFIKNDKYGLFPAITLDIAYKDLSLNN